MARAKKLPSGSWRVQVYTGMENGKRKYISITAPTEKEANYAALQYQMGVDRKARVGKTVGEAIDEYIASRDGVLSPTTIQAYKKYRKSYLHELMDVPIKMLTRETLQRAVNDEAKRESRYGRSLSAKTLRNAYGLVSAAIKCAGGAVDTDVTLPARQKHLTTMLDPSQVFDLVRGTEIELPVLLALWLGMSMSEIRGIRTDSIQDGVLTIDRAVVDVDGERVEKDKTKAYDRTRRLRVPPYILGLIQQHGADGYIIQSTGKAIYNKWIRLQQKAGIEPQMRFHDLRHLNASVMLALGVPDKYAMERGGWSTPHVMKSVYQHTFAPEREIIDRRVDEYMQHAMQHGGENG